MSTGRAVVIVGHAAVLDAATVRPRATAILAVDGAIVAVGEPKDILAAAPPDHVRHDWNDHLLCPGTVNAHNHSFQSLLRGVGDDLPFLAWREQALYRYAPRLGPEGVGTGALLAFGEMLLHGVTTVCDFFYVNGQSNDCADAVLTAAQQLGIRAVLARCFYDWDGAPAVFRETNAQAVAHAEALHKRWHDATRFLTQVHVAPHSLHGASEGMIRDAAALAAQLDVPWHIHLAEEAYQVDDALKRYGRRPLHAVAAMIPEFRRMIAVHGCWFDDGERALLSERGGALAYCPGSNMFLGDGVTDLVDLHRRGVTVALGTDGGCSNNRVSVFDEMRQAALLQKVHRCDGQAIAAEPCFAMGTELGGKALGLPVGALRPGMRCDVVAINRHDPSLWPPTAPLKNLVYALSPRAISHVMVDGNVVVQDGALVQVPWLDIERRIEELTRSWTR